jgi:hypothetical protein
VKTKQSVYSYGQLNNTSLLVKPSNHTRNHWSYLATRNILRTNNEAQFYFIIRDWRTLINLNYGFFCQEFVRNTNPHDKHSAKQRTIKYRQLSPSHHSSHELSNSINSKPSHTTTDYRITHFHEPAGGRHDWPITAAEWLRHPFHARTAFAFCTSTASI